MADFKANGPGGCCCGGGCGGICVRLLDPCDGTDIAGATVTVYRSSDDSTVATATADYTSGVLYYCAPIDAAGSYYARAVKSGREAIRVDFPSATCTRNSKAAYMPLSGQLWLVHVNGCPDGGAVGGVPGATVTIRDGATVLATGVADAHGDFRTPAQGTGTYSIDASSAVPGFVATTVSRTLYCTGTSTSLYLGVDGDHTCCGSDCYQPIPKTLDASVEGHAVTLTLGTGPDGGGFYGMMSVAVPTRVPDTSADPCGNDYVWTIASVLMPFRIFYGCGGAMKIYGLMYYNDYYGTGGLWPTLGVVYRSLPFAQAATTPTTASYPDYPVPTGWALGCGGAEWLVAEGDGTPTLTCGPYSGSGSLAARNGAHTPFTTWAVVEPEAGG